MAYPEVKKILGEYQGKKKTPFVKAEGMKVPQKPAAPKEEDIFESQSPMRNLVDRARKATGKQVR